MIESILLVVSPLVVTGLTALSKAVLPVVAKLKSPYLIAFVAVLSYVIALFNAALTGTDVDFNSIQTLSDTIVNLLGASGAYFLAGKLQK